MGVRGRALGIAVAAIATLGLSGNALAATSEYAPEPQSQNFNGGGGGWGFASEYGGLCIPAVSCYTVGSEAVAEGGPTGPGDGFLRVDLFTIANAVTETNAILSSPVFTYKGVDGKRPRRLTFLMDRRTDLGAVLPVIADNATYTVKAAEVGGPATTLVESTSMEGAEDAWVSVPRVVLDRDELDIGKQYQLQIISTFAAGVSVIGTATADYDNVILRARGGGGAGGGGGQAGAGAGFVQAVKNLIGNATVKGKGKKLLVPVGCPRFVAPNRCALKVAAKFKKTGPKVTNNKNVKVKAGKKKIAKLRVKPQYREALTKRKRVVVHIRAKAGGKSRTVTKSVRVRQG